MKDEKTHPNSGKFSLSILLYAGLWNSRWRWSESMAKLSLCAIPWIEEKYRENPASWARIHWLVPWKALSQSSLREFSDMCTFPRTGN